MIECEVLKTHYQKLERCYSCKVEFNDIKYCEDGIVNYKKQNCLWKFIVEKDLEKIANQEETEFPFLKEIIEDGRRK